MSLSLLLSTQNALACVADGEEDRSTPSSSSSSSSSSIFLDLEKLENFGAPRRGNGVTGIAVSPNVPKIPQPDTVRAEHRRGASARQNGNDRGNAAEKDGRNNPLGVSEGEWRARTQLAALYRGLYLHGLERSTIGSDQAAQCVMMRHPEVADEFLMAPWGLWFEEVTASSLRRYTLSGVEVDSQSGARGAKKATAFECNIGCVPVADAIFTQRKDVNAIVHVHPYAVMAVGAARAGLLPVSQANFFLWKQVSREPYDFSYESDFTGTLSAGFANGERAMLLNNHGMYAVGRTAAEAAFVATHLTQACEVQVRAMALVGGDVRKLHLPEEAKLDAQYIDMMNSPDYAYDGSREWPGLVRKVEREAPGYNL